MRVEVEEEEEDGGAVRDERELHPAAEGTVEQQRLHGVRHRHHELHLPSQENALEQQKHTRGCKGLG